MTQPHTIRVDAFRALPDLLADLRVARVLARLMDSQFNVGGIKFGLDALVGLIPIAGDVISMVAALYPVYLARKHGLGRTVVARMLSNVAIDFSVGLVPILGDATDLLFKANLKNVKILEECAHKRGHRVD